MAVIVIALGVIMVLGGGCEVYFGSTYITVERGWSAFISGTVLLTGGLVTIAIGFAIRALATLAAALTSFDPTQKPIVSGSGVEPTLAGPNPAEPVVSVAAANDPHGTSNILLEHDASTGHAEPGGAVLAETLAPEPVPAMPSADHTRDDPHVEEQVREPETFESAPSLAAEAERLVPIGAAGAAPARTMPHPDPAGAETAAAMDDWLDRSFAEIAHKPVEDPHPLPRAEQAPAYAVSAEPVLVADVPPAKSAVEADHGRDGRPGSPTPAAPEPAVIGRYEAEGTSYVMYSDGSIDAQSAAGVYRFASMAELKAFIEG